MKDIKPQLAVENIEEFEIRRPCFIDSEKYIFRFH